MLKNKQSGFTLVELLVAMAIIAVLIGLAVGAISLVQRVSRDTQRRNAVAEINAQLNAYYGTNSRYPDSATAGSSDPTRIRRVGTDIVVGTGVVSPGGAASAGAATDTTQTQYCYELQTNGYLLGSLLEDGTWDITQSTSPTASTTDCVGTALL
jgi:prepilin-type N-terminal cleavage/methylation domain-containing protein